MKRAAVIVIVTIVTALLLSGVIYVWGPSSAPRGQDALVALSDGNLNEFKAAFDANSEIPRLVLLLSPT